MALLEGGSIPPGVGQSIVSKVRATARDLDSIARHLLFISKRGFARHLAAQGGLSWAMDGRRARLELQDAFFSRRDR